MEIKVSQDGSLKLIQYLMKLQQAQLSASYIKDT